MLVRTLSYPTDYIVITGQTRRVINYCAVNYWLDNYHAPSKVPNSSSQQTSQWAGGISIRQDNRNHVAVCGNRIDHKMNQGREKTFTFCDPNTRIWLNLQMHSVHMYGENNKASNTCGMARFMCTYRSSRMVQWEQKDRRKHFANTDFDIRNYLPARQCRVGNIKNKESGSFNNRLDFPARPDWGFKIITVSRDDSSLL